MEHKRIISPCGTSKTTGWRGLIGIVPVAIGLMFPLAAQASEFAGHKAVYTIVPGNFESGGDFVGVSGNMELSLENNCNGWTMSQTLQMNLQMADGNELRQFHRYTGQELSDGTRYNFFSSSRVADNREDFRGRAHMEHPDGAGNAVFRIPEGKSIPLPETTKFPLGHTAFLIKRAQAGDRLVPAIVFDGADAGGPQEVTAFIGRKQHASEVIGKVSVESLGPLADRAGWKIRMAFYKLDSQGAIPEYEVEALQLENGVTPWILLDYHDFSVVMKMIKLEAILPPKC